MKCETLIRKLCIFQLEVERKLNRRKLLSIWREIALEERPGWV